MLQRSTERYVLADSSKLGRVALRRVCEVSGVSAVITDAEAPGEVVDSLRARGVRVLVAPLDAVVPVALDPASAGADPLPMELPVPHARAGS
jgi:hypothetical protein